MDTPSLLRQLKTMEPELRSAGMNALYLFGSRARGDYRPDSDVDLLYEVGNMDVDYLRLLDVKHDLAIALQISVDLVQRSNLHSLVTPFVEPDLVRIF